MPQLTDELKRIQDRKAEVREERATAIAERDEFRGKVESAEEVDRESDDFKSAKEAARKAGSLGDQLTDLTNNENELLVMLGRGDEVEASENGNGPEDKAQAARVKSTLREAAAKIIQEGSETFALYAASSAQTGKRRLGELATREQAAEFLRTPQAATLVASDVQPLIPEDRRGPRGLPAVRTRFLDLLPIGETSSNSVETVIEQPTALTADMVVDGADVRKPEEAIEFLPGDFPVRTVAAWIKLHKNALEDAPRVRGLLDRRLPQKLRKRLEIEAIAGSGIAPHLRGILNTTGIGVETQTAADPGPPVVVQEPDVEAILDALTLVIMTDFDPNFVALSPLKWAAIRKMREQDNAGQYLFGSPAAAGDTTVWGVLATASASIANNRALVGDTDGAELTVRSGIQVLISDSDGEDFTHNRVTVLAEGRFALPVEQPGAFARVEFV